MDVHSLICVRPPYFALEDVRASTTGVQAKVSVEQDLGREQGPISGAEAGRHLAILGSCALARVNPQVERHYYLASAAELERLAPAAPPAPGKLRAFAHAWFTGKRAGRAQCTLHSAGRPIYSLDVSYTVLTEGAFQRLFASARREAPVSSPGNPHTLRPALDAMVVQGRRASCLLSPLEPQACAGHFDDYPMMPVAAVMRHLSDLAGELLACIDSDSRASYVVRRARVRAFNFALPREQLMLEVEYGGSSPDFAHAFSCRATAPGGKSVGEMNLVLAAGPSASAARDADQLSVW